MPKKKLKFEVTNYQVSIWPLCMLAEMLAYYFDKLAGIGLEEMKIGQWQNQTNQMAVNAQEHDKVARYIQAKIIKDPDWTFKTIKRISQECGQLLKFTDQVFKSDLEKKSDEELYDLYMKYRKKFINMYIYSWMPNAIEGLSGLFTKKLEVHLKDELESLGRTDQLGKYLSVLTTPFQETNRQKEERDLLEIIKKINESKETKELFKKELEVILRELEKVNPDINQLIDQHHQKYCWLGFNYDGPAWDKDYFVDLIRSLIEQNIDPKIRLDEITREKEEMKKLQKKFASEIGLERDEQHSYLFEVARKLMFIKDFRKDVLFKSYYQMDKLIREIGKRLGLSSIQVKHILPQEMEEVLINKNYSVEQLNQRIKYSVLLYDKKGIKIYTGQKAREIVKQYVAEKKVLEVSELRGQCAFPGQAKGKVKLIFERKDILKMNQGDILVSQATNPNLLPAVKKAAAIITDRGGITCHAAIISRELKIPCIIGTRIATKVLKDGDRVEVDADQGIVRKHR